jgi:folate-binding protein YgfZ
MRLRFLADKSVLRFRPAAARFLKDYTTNSLDASENAFVDIQGRIVAVFAQRALSEDDVVAVVGTAFVERLKKHLSKYLPLFDTKIEDAPYRVYHDLDSSHIPKAGEITIPRKKGEYVLTQENYPSTVSDEEYKLFRLRNGMPEQGEDFDETMLLNISEDAVSYTKGCYLGQEIIARVHYKGKPPKSLVIKRESECSPDERLHMTSRAKDPASGDIFGFVFISS